MDFFAVRRARLLQAFTPLYPEIVPNVWMSALKASQLVQQANLRHERPLYDQRVLPEDHFEFQGGKRSRQNRTGVRVTRLDARAGSAGTRRRAWRVALRFRILHPTRSRLRTAST
jgi:hypothetical protein